MKDASTEPGVADGAPEPAKALARARWISRILDDLVRVPGTRRRVGLDPLLGLVPGLGDALVLVVSLDLLVSAARFGAGGTLLARMLGNLVLDVFVGMVPVAGDLFDLGWKANRRNLLLLEGHVADPERTRRRSRWVVGGVLGGAFGVVVGGMWVGWVVLRWVAGLV